MAFVLCLLKALIVTAVIEGLIIFLRYRRGDYLLYSLLCNLLTNPALNVAAALLLPFLEGVAGWAVYPAVAALEAAVVLAEALVYRYLCGFKLKSALFLSFMLNLSSFLFSFVL